MKTDTSRILSLLEAERVALLAGDYERLPRIGADVAAWLDSLPQGADMSRFPAIARAAHRNQRLLAASLAGLRAGESRLSAIRRGTEVQTYTRDGHRRTLPVQAASINKRA